MTTRQPQARIGDYELVRLLGQGGMGDVWMASDTRAERPVALKFIKPHLLDDPGFRTRFLNEAKTLGRLEHDRIVTLYNVVENGTHLALVLRFIDGHSLADRIDNEGALPLETVLAYSRDLLPALGFAHQQGIIHRDIKPQNVLLDRHGRAFLTDFGIAVGDFAERSTVTGMAVGTPHYMSPEQIQTPRAITLQNGGHRSDIYSFGIVLFEMLSGRVPFGGDTGPEEFYRVQHAHCVEAPPSLAEWNPAVPLAVEAVVLRCLAKDPNDRPQSCGELLELLQEAVSSKAVAVPVRGARAATVVERAPAPAESRPAPAVQPAPKRRSGVPKSAWLATGALVVVASVGFAVWSSNSGQGGREVTPPTPSSTFATEEPSTTSAIDSSGQAQVPKPLNQPPTDPSKAAYERALAQYRGGDPCGAQQTAATLPASQPSYASLQKDTASACLQKQAESRKPANSLVPEPTPGAGIEDAEKGRAAYAAGDYCKAQTLFQSALGKEPGNATYSAQLDRAAKACNLTLQ